MWDEATHIEQLEEIYKESLLRTMDVLLKKESKNQSTLFYKNQLKEVLGILNKLDSNYMDWINKNVPAAYSAATVEAEAYFQRLYLQKVINYDKYPYKEFSQVHQNAVDVLAQNLADNLRSSTQYVGRQFQDVFRNEQLRQTALKIASGKTVNEMAKDMAESLRTQGIVCFKDSLGRNWSLQTYAKMCARTVTRQATTTATINTCMSHSVDLVQISSHSGSCAMCQAIQGKIYSLSGKSTAYSKYGENEVFIPRHPNCAHVVMPFVEELNNNENNTKNNVSNDENSGIIESEFTTPQSLGAMAKKFYVKAAKDLKNPFSEESTYLKEGTTVTGIKAIAGKGMNRQIDDINRLIDTYKKSDGKDTRPEDWIKVRGDAVVTDGTTDIKAEVHWYQCENVGKIEFKIKKYKDG